MLEKKLLVTGVKTNAYAVAICAQMYTLWKPNKTSFYLFMFFEMMGTIAHAFEILPIPYGVHKFDMYKEIVTIEDSVVNAVVTIATIIIAILFNIRIWNEVKKK